MAQNPFIGTWRLVSFESRTTEGQVDYPFGRDAVGTLMYSADGTMAVGITAMNRPRFASGDYFGGTQEEKAAAAVCLFYLGRYTILPDRVVHHIEISYYPNWIGVDQERFYTFDRNRLMLRTPPLLIDGAVRTSYLTWEHI